MKPKPLPSREIVGNFIDYDPETGNATWIKSPARNIKAGSPVGTINRGYLVVRFQGKSYPLHRLCWLLETNQDPAESMVDHIDGNRLNNAFANLRLCNNSQNGMNRGATKANKLGVKGVCWDRTACKYKAYIQISGKKKHIGNFADLESAIDARRSFEAEIFGTFAKLS
jgi:hypothetical protein